MTYLTFGNVEPEIDLMNELLSKCPNLKNLTIQHVSLNALPDLSLCSKLTSLMANAPIEKVGLSLQDLKELQNFQAIGWEKDDYGFLQYLGDKMTNLQITTPCKRWSNLLNIGQWKGLVTLRLDKCDELELLRNQEKIKPKVTEINVSCRMICAR
ncbi:MAG: hypothetical protein ACI9XO_004958 [Paraglaciecola sp.]|jgi:hypothetical protein